MDCKNDHHSDWMQGLKNSNYKHWLALDNYPREFYKSRKIILERDWNKCVICSKDENLVIHHKDCNPMNNDLWNLITVCSTCHATHHHSKLTPYPQLSA
jgi:hypothetical protein